MKKKPAHLGPQYGVQFQDKSVVHAYDNRPAYPLEVFDILETLLGKSPSSLLELGAGRGDLTIELARRVDHLDAVEPSPAMLASAHRREGSQRPNLHWHQMTAEQFQPQRQYALVLAGQSLHWMDWEVVLPMIAHVLIAGGMLAIIERQVLQRPWDQTVLELIPHYSTNQDFVPYDIVEELASRHLFKEIGRNTTAPVPFEQSLDNYIEALHSSNGLSRERMSPDMAQEFDTAVRAAAKPYCPNNQVHGQVTGTIIWGEPMPSHSPNTHKTWASDQAH